MKVIKNLLVPFAMSTLIIACSNHQQSKAQTAIHADSGTAFKYVDLRNFKYKSAFIKPGTEVEILANLGGRESVGDTVYYYQFIVLDKKTGDTIRILCPDITVEDAAIENKTSITPLMYNPEKGIITAFFEPIDSAATLLLNGNNLKKLTESINSVDVNHLLDSKNAINIVVLDKDDSEQRIFQFGTVIGKLNFKKIPW
jgi:hypothetical protein